LKSRKERKASPLLANDTASLVRWIKAQASADLPQLDRIDLFETRGCGTIFAWGADDPALPI
jgi:6-pyruvoyltetrahydropterin/6-carboxytetrahydropterin synthase